MSSISKYDVLYIYMWYHFLIEVTSNDVVKKWTSQIWVALWNNDVKLLANVWNSNLKKSKMFVSYNVRQANAARRTIRIMMSELSQKWKIFLKKQHNNIQLYIVRKKFYVKQKRKKSNKFIFLFKYKYIKDYKFMIKQRIENIDFSNKIKEFIKTYHKITCVKFSEREIWHVTKSQFNLIKVENLL